MNYKNKKNVTEFLKYQKAVLKKYINYIKNKMQTDYKRAALFVYWLDEYLKYVKAEKSFNPSHNITYKRGQIVFVNFGYRIGTELGGNHYAIVLDTKNSRYANTVTVVPLKSKKDKISKYAQVYHVSLGYTIGKMIYNKSLDIQAEYLEQAKELAAAAPSTPAAKKEYKAKNAKINRLLRLTEETMNFAEKMNKKESVADTGQIITISKQRIITPCKPQEPLANIVLPEELLALIDERLLGLYLDNFRKSDYT